MLGGLVRLPFTLVGYALRLVKNSFLIAAAVIVLGKKWNIFP